MSSFAPGILVDESGRRRRALRFVGRAISVLLLIWLGVLALAWLGIEPLGNLGFVEPGGRATPPALPARIESAVTGGRIVAPRHSVAVVGIGARPTPGARGGGGTGPRGNIHRRTGPALNAKPVHKHLPVRASIPGHTGTTPPSAQAQRPPARSGKKPRETTGAANPGKSQSSPGHAKKRATAPSSTSSPGKSTTSPGHTKEPSQTPAQPAPASHGSTGPNGNSANGKAVGNPHNRTATSPAP
jgi:hypothetical protein